MPVRFLCAFQVDEDKIYDVGSHVNLYNYVPPTIKDPAKYLAAQVCAGNSISGPRWTSIVYMFISVDNVVKSYTFTKDHGAHFDFNMVRGLVAYDIAAGLPKEELFRACIQNMHEQINNSLQLVKTSAQLLGATAATYLIKEKAYAKLVLSTPNSPRDEGSGKEVQEGNGNPGQEDQGTTHS